MTPNSPSDWVAWAGIALPLAALAWSAIWYVLIEAEKNQKARYDRFFELMDQVGRKGISISAQMAAAYELRKYPEYKDVIVRLMRDTEIDGGNANLLKREFDLTIKHLGGVGRTDVA